MGMMEDLISRLLAYEVLSKHEVEYVCERVTDTMIHEPNIQRISSPVVVVGDIHGQFTDLQTMLQIRGPPGKASYVSWRLCR